MSETVNTNREYKDKVFIRLFGHEKYKANLLSLYNAMNDTDYTNVENLQICTLDGVIYMHMKNDVSFIFDNYLILYEHQSTINPNMPLRGFLYAARNYEKILGNGQDHLAIYSSKLVEIPTPQYCVFYNGTTAMEDVRELKLSDAFSQPVKKGSYEWTAFMYNINVGHNKQIMEKCKTLQEYSVLMGKVREFLKVGTDRNSAVTQAIDWCIEHQVLRDFLMVEKAEVIGMILEEYDEQAHMKMIRDEAREEGIEEGKQAGITIGYEKARLEHEQTDAEYQAKIRELEEKLREYTKQE